MSSAPCETPRRRPPTSCAKDLRAPARASPSKRLRLQPRVVPPRKGAPPNRARGPLAEVRAAVGPAAQLLGSSATSNRSKASFLAPTRPSPAAIQLCATPSRGALHCPNSFPRGFSQGGWLAQAMAQRRHRARAGRVGPRRFVSRCGKRRAAWGRPGGPQTPKRHMPRVTSAKGDQSPWPRLPKPGSARRGLVALPSAGVARGPTVCSRGNWRTPTDVATPCSTRAPGRHLPRVTSARGDLSPPPIEAARNRA